jgi:hypothetical protein
MGIALCHFELAARAVGLTASFEIADPKLSADDDTRYIGSFDIGR